MEEFMTTEEKVMKTDEEEVMPTEEKVMKTDEEEFMPTEEKVSLAALPTELVTILKSLDFEEDNSIALEDIEKAVAKYVEAKTSAKKGFVSSIVHSFDDVMKNIVYNENDSIVPSIKNQLYTAKKINEKGIDLSVLSDDTAEKLKPLDLDGDNFISTGEIETAGKSLLKVRRQNERLRRTILVLFVGYVILAATIGGLVYWIMMLNKDTQILTGSSSLMTTTSHSMNPEPVSVNSNEIVLTLGMIPFLPRDVVSKIDTFVMKDKVSGADLHRKVASIDVLPDSGFSITTSVGDTLIWDSMDMTTDIMKLTLSDGTISNYSVLCDKCTALNVVPTQKGIEEAVDAYEQFYESIYGEAPTSDGKPGNRFLQTRLEEFEPVSCSF